MQVKLKGKSAGGRICFSGFKKSKLSEENIDSEGDTACV
jgi:hypothetical protein